MYVRFALEPRLTLDNLQEARRLATVHRCLGDLFSSETGAKQIPFVM